ncbi:hypothetical protein BGZ76_007103 [Entomortierella beljakovae]|nr:hypothetical protein BGZ76_007103 [Entomortierella beljakovae]
MDDNELAKYFPTSFGKSSSKPKTVSEPKKTTPKNDDTDFLRAFMPTSFGKQKSQKNSIAQPSKRSSNEGDTDMDRSRSEGVSTSNVQSVKEQGHEAEKDPKKSDNSRKSGNITSSSDDDDDDDSDDDDNGGVDAEMKDDNEDIEGGLDQPDSSTIPISHEIILNDHAKTVSAMSLDPAGVRLVTGGYDFNVCFWDFAGMDTRFKPFRSMEPCGAHQIHELKYSLTGDKILIISGEAKARIYDRNGTEVAEYQKGDPYIRDLRLTSGHVSALTSGCWHPNSKDRFITSSNDGTIRLWDVENIRKQADVIAYKTKERGGRTSVSAVTYSSDGKLIAGAATDGTVCLYPSNGPFLRSTHTIENAHVKGTETTGITFSKDSQRMVTRGGDDTVKIWDVRNLKHPLAIAEDMSSLNSEVNVIYSPNERLIVTGTGVRKNEGYGKIVMMNSDTLEIVRTVSVTQSSVVKVLWHDKLNQIIAGNADGSVRVYYDPEVSTKGALLCASRAPKKRAIDDYEIDRPIITPHALPMFKEDKIRSNKRKQEKMRSDPMASHRPELPLSGPGRGGKVGHSTIQHVLAGVSKDRVREEDPRAALLKYAEVVEKDPQWITPAYKKNQPNPVFDESQHTEREQKRKK